MENKNEKAPNVFRRAESHVQSRTLQGFVALIPLLVTVILVVFLVERTDGYIRSLPFVEGEPWNVPGIGLLTLLVVFYLVGSLGSVRPGRRALRLMDGLFSRIPLVRIFYKVTQQGVNSITSPSNFTRVVFVEWPREGMVALGFVTGRVFSPNTSASLAVVYIPTVPNPTSGNMAFVHEDDVLETNLSVDAAMQMVFSGGIVLPEQLVLARVPLEERESGETFVGEYRSMGPR